MVADATKLLAGIEPYRLWRRGLPPDAVVGLVPTMGALHAGHAALMRRARQDCDVLVVSIFVNPMQFGPNEDYQRYPRSLDNDLQICAEQGVDVVFNPQVEEIYPLAIADSTKVVPPEKLVNTLCGVFRPGHFQGVATVVMKFFGIVKPDSAFFGEKDYQQLAIIKQMVRDLNVGVEIQAVPTVREDDGLALSSRNVYLSAEQRALAPELYRTLSRIRQQILDGSLSISRATAEGRQRLSQLGFEVQYLTVVDAQTLAPLTQASPPLVVLVAAKLGDIRLIDNLIAG